MRTTLDAIKAEDRPSHEGRGLKRKTFESRWGVVLGKRVTVWLKDHAKPLSGMLEWLEPAKPGKEKDASPRFRLRGLEFGVGEIESIVQEE